MLWTDFNSLNNADTSNPNFDVSQIDPNSLPLDQWGNRYVPVWQSGTGPEGQGMWTASPPASSPFWTQYGEHGTGSEGNRPPGYNEGVSGFLGSGIPTSDVVQGASFVGSALASPILGSAADVSAADRTGSQNASISPYNNDGTSTAGAGGTGGGMDLSFLGPLVGGVAGGVGLAQGGQLSNPSLTGQQQDLVTAGNQTYQTALDPRGALYGRTAQQVQDQTRASDSARGVAMSPYSAGVENKAMSDFNIDWQNQQLARQATGVQAMTGANQASTGVGQLGLANRQFGAGQNSANLTALLTALFGGNGAGAGGLSGLFGPGAGGAAGSGGLAGIIGRLFSGGTGTGGTPGAPGAVGATPGAGTSPPQDFGNDPSTGLPITPPVGDPSGGGAAPGFDDFTGGFGDLSAGFNWNTPMPGAGGTGGAGYYGGKPAPAPAFSGGMGFA